MAKHDMKDSGKRQTFNDGAVRDVGEGKGSYELITPIGLRRVALVYEKGAKKYDPRNWEKGIPIGRILQSAIRHLYQYIEGYRDEDHLGHAAWNCLAAIHMEEMVERGLLPKELNDMPNFLPDAVKAPEEMSKYVEGISGIRSEEDLSDQSLEG